MIVVAELIVSVRSAEEARLALNGGAALIDVKEPRRGSLGRADDATLEAILRVSGDVPVSAARGELVEDDEAGVPFLDRLTFVKWGLAKAPRTWRKRLDDRRSWIETVSRCQVVLAAYADHRRAVAPSPADVVHHAIHERYAAVLLDTCVKDGTTLLDWLSTNDVHDLVASCEAAGVQVSLAGGLNLEEIERLASLRPRWFAVRGAACDGGRRDAPLEEHRVRELVERLLV